MVVFRVTRFFFSARDHAQELQEMQVSFLEWEDPEGGSDPPVLLHDPMDRGAQRDTVHSIAKSWTG